MYGKKSKMKIKALTAGPITIVAWLLLLSVPAFGLDSSLHGSYKVYLGWIYDADWQGGSSGIADNILRLDARFSTSGVLSVELAYVLYPEIRSTSTTRQVVSLAGQSAEYRVGNPVRRLFPSSDRNMDNIGLYQDIDRAAVTVHLPFADVYAGRQAVSWGSAHVVNPTDILVPFRFMSLDTEYRKGVDALRVRVPFASMDEIDVGYVAGEDFRFNKSAVFGRTRLYLLKTDLAFTGIVFKENLLLGWDIARAVGNAGVWLEAAWVTPDMIQRVEDPLDESYLGISVGADYNFTGDFYGYLEYHFNSAGENDPHDYIDLVMNPADHPAYSKENVYLLGKRYLSVGGNYSGIPLMPVTFLLMVNANDLSADISVSAEYNIKENIYIEGGFFLGLGPEPDLQAGVPVRYNSEFGAYPDVLYTAVKTYF
jgi:hypothetical protein